MEEQERERRRQVVEKFQKAPFEEIAAHCGARVRQKAYSFLLISAVFPFFFFAFSHVYFLCPSGHTAAEQTQSDLRDNNQVRVLKARLDHRTPHIYTYCGGVLQP